MICYLIKVCIGHRIRPKPKRSSMLFWIDCQHLYPLPKRYVFASITKPIKFLIFFFFLVCFHAPQQMYNINGLQKVCDILLENPSWTIAHLISYFNLTEYIGHPKVVDLIDEPDYATNMTPIQVSIVKWNNVNTINHIIIAYYIIHVINLSLFPLSLCTAKLQLAIKCNHLEMVKKLLPQCRLNHLDNNMNSIFHYAAPTTKEIINVSLNWIMAYDNQ